MTHHDHDHEPDHEGGDQLDDDRPWLTVLDENGLPAAAIPAARTPDGDWYFDGIPAGQPFWYHQHHGPPPPPAQPMKLRGAVRVRMWQTVLLLIPGVTFIAMSVTDTHLGRSLLWAFLGCVFLTFVPALLIQAVVHELRCDQDDRR